MTEKGNPTLAEVEPDPSQPQETSKITPGVAAAKSEYRRVAKALHRTVDEVQTALQQAHVHAQRVNVALSKCEHEKKKRSFRDTKRKAMETIAKLTEFGNTYPGLQQFPKKLTENMLADRFHQQGSQRQFQECLTCTSPCAKMGAVCQCACPHRAHGTKTRRETFSI
jgi:hypothetical protein